jgi:hypothetical protein
VDDWLRAARDRIAVEAGEGAGDLDLTQEEIDEMLELARSAAHESGERINAPLLSYLVGLARGRTEADLSALIDAVLGR